MSFHLTASLAGSGYHPASWRYSSLSAQPNAAQFRAMACAAERGRLDAILLGLPVMAPSGAGSANTMRIDPLPLLGSLIAMTRQIGLGAAWTVDYTEPYNVARVFATLDHLSYGRTAWIAAMFGTEALVPFIGRSDAVADPAAYCDRAGEFIDVVQQLWDSWEDEAFALDKASGMFVDPERVYPINHVGSFFSVRGPLNVPRPPQGHPVLVQVDPDTAIGRQLVARTAEVVLTSCSTLSAARERYRELHALAGRRAGGLRILANVLLVLGDTEAKARQRAAELDASAKADAPRFVGTPEQLAAFLSLWSEAGACDGFNLMPAVLPDDLDHFVDRVIPLLQQRDLFRSDYTGKTLRDHLGLSRPSSQFASQSVEFTRS